MRSALLLDEVRRAGIPAEAEDTIQRALEALVAELEGRPAPAVRNAEPAAPRGAVANDDDPDDGILR